MVSMKTVLTYLFLVFGMFMVESVNFQLIIGRSQSVAYIVKNNVLITQNPLQTALVTNACEFIIFFHIGFHKSLYIFFYLIPQESKYKLYLKPGISNEFLRPTYVH